MSQILSKIQNKSSKNLTSACKYHSYINNVVSIVEYFGSDNWQMLRSKLSTDDLHKFAVEKLKAMKIPFLAIDGEHIISDFCKISKLLTNKMKTDVSNFDKTAKYGEYKFINGFVVVKFGSDILIPFVIATISIVISGISSYMPEIKTHASELFYETLPSLEEQYPEFFKFIDLLEMPTPTSKEVKAYFNDVYPGEDGKEILNTVINNYYKDIDEIYELYPMVGYYIEGQISHFISLIKEHLEEYAGENKEQIEEYAGENKEQIEADAEEAYEEYEQYEE